MGTPGQTTSATQKTRSGIAAGVFGLLMSVGTATAQPFQGDINRWVAQDALDPPSTGGVLFIGSSSVRRWEELSWDFSDYNIIQRGFGGALFDDVNTYLDDIVTPYAPAAIVVWAGTNDLSGGSSAAEVFADYTEFVTRTRAALPAVEIFYLGVTPTPANAGTTAARDAANAQIAAEAALDPQLHYIDLPTAFNALNPPSDSAFTELYVDPVHLNRAGYALWTSIVRPQFEVVVPPNRVFVANPQTMPIGGRLLFDFGPSNPQDGTQTIGPDVRGNVWNNWHPAEGGVAVNAGEHIGGLVDVNGAATGIGLTITGGFSTNGLVNGGLRNPEVALLGDLAVDSATQDYFFSGADDRPGFGNDDVPGGFVLDGLDPSFVYEVRFFGSRAVGGSTRRTEYLVRGANERVVVLQTTGTNIGADGVYDGNDDEIAVASGVRPDSFGRVFVDLTVEAGEFGYINAMELRVLDTRFVVQPDDVVVDAGGTLVFTAQADVSGGGTLGWERDGEALVDGGRVSGASGETLVILNAGVADNGSYRLVADGPGGVFVSEQAVGGVRESGVVFDVNGDGVVDLVDLLDLAGRLSGGSG